MSIKQDYIELVGRFGVIVVAKVLILEPKNLGYFFQNA